MSELNPMPVQKSGASQNYERKSCQSKPVRESHLDLLREGTFSDATFIVGPRKERIPCHQIFLKARSPVFGVMFNERWNQDSNKEVLLEDVDPKIFKKFLEYIYADTLVDNVSEALELLQLAHMYDVQLLVSKCEKLLENQVTLKEAVDVFQAARKYEKIQLMDKVGNLMAKSLSKLQNLPSFSRVDKETLVYILKRNDLKMKELDLFRLALQWSKHQSGWTMQDVLPLIRFPTMTLEEFTATVVPTGLLPLSTLVQVFTYFGSDAETRKLLASTLKFSTQRREVDDGDEHQFRRFPATSSVALYSGDWSRCRSTRQSCMRLYERLELCIFVVDDGVGLTGRPPALLNCLPAKANIALSGISLYCPTKTTNYSGRFTSNLPKEFQILVKAKINDNDSYEDVFSLSAVKAEEGNITEVEFDPAIPVESGKYFRFIAQETEGKQDTRGYEDNNYEVKDFGNIHQNVMMAVGDRRVFVGCTSGGNALDSRGRYHPQLIYKLGLKEC